MISFDEAVALTDVPLDTIWNTIRQEMGNQGEVSAEIFQRLLVVRCDTHALICLLTPRTDSYKLRYLVSNDPDIASFLPTKMDLTLYFNDLPHTESEKSFSDDFQHLAQHIISASEAALPKHYFGSIALIVGGLLGGVVTTSIFAGLNWFIDRRKRLALLTWFFGLLILPLGVTVLASIISFMPVLAGLRSLSEFSIIILALIYGGLVGGLIGAVFSRWQLGLFKDAPRQSIVLMVLLAIAGGFYSLFLSFVLLPPLEPYILPIVAATTPRQTFSESGVTFDYPGGWRRQTDLSPLADLCTATGIECLWWASIISYDTGIVAYRVSAMRPTNVYDVAEQMETAFRNQLPNIRQLQNREYEVDGHIAFEQLYIAGERQFFMTMIQDGWGVLILRLDGSSSNVDRLISDVQDVIDSLQFVGEQTP